MKKFHFYIENCQPSDIRSGDDLGDKIRSMCWYWNKRHLNPEWKSVKVTIWLSQKKLCSIAHTRIHGCVYLEPEDRYSKSAVMDAIERSYCDSFIHGKGTNPGGWFGRAKVERVK